MDNYWLTGNPNFSVEHFLDKLTPRQHDPKYYGKEQVVMLNLKGKTIGFGGYWMKNFYEGKVHFLYIDKAYRGRGYSIHLMKYMIKQLFEQGAKIIKLCTRVNNVPARRLYTQVLNFDLVEDDGVFVLFELRAPK